MHFIHNYNSNNDTIAAIATPAGTGAIAVIRISGPIAFAIAEKIFTGPVKNFKSHTAHYGKIIDRNGDPIDAVLLFVMKGPKSYTGEDTIEISCHGSPLIARKILERIYEVGGRAAEPGEFSKRAFLNGKIDLAQAEAVQDLISSKNELAMQTAEKLLSGDLSKTVKIFQKELTDVAAILEAWVDFPEEGLEFAAFDELIEKLQKIQTRIQNLISTFHEGKILHQGLTLCLLGAPNVGKSSLMNALLGKNRAIVTNIAGTTRDILEEDFSLSGLHFKLVDTAGIRNTQEIIEKEGIERSKLAMQEADLILLLLDSSRSLESEEIEWIQTIPKEKTILVWNKIDLQMPFEQIDWEYQTSISAKEKIGLENLKQTIDRFIWKKGPPSKEEITITKLRHKSALQNCAQSLQTVIDGLQKRVSAEFVASDMRSCLNDLGTIIGANVTEDILTSIFSQFCLGK